MMAVEIATEPSFSAGKPRLLFEGRYEQQTWGGHPSYDVMPDGQRFLMLMATEQDDQNRLNVVLNRFDELKRRSTSAK